MDIPGWSPRNHMRQHFEADLPWDTICNISLYISDLLHTHHFLTIKKHSKLSLSKRMSLKPMTSGNPACQGLPVLARWSRWDTFTRRVLPAQGQNSGTIQSGTLSVWEWEPEHHPELQQSMPRQTLTSGCRHGLWQRSRCRGRRCWVHSCSIWREHPVLLLTFKFLQVRNFPELLWDGSINNLKPTNIIIRFKG